MTSKLTLAATILLASTATQAVDINKGALFNHNSASKNCAGNLAQLAGAVQSAGKLPNLEVALANGNPEKLSPPERQLFDRAEAVAKHCKGLHGAFQNAVNNLDAMDKAGKTPSAEELAEIRELDAGMKQVNEAFANAQKVPAMGGFLRRILNTK